jgi:ABC-type transport system involved in cytochrome c biogenesis permease subunit
MKIFLKALPWFFVALFGAEIIAVFAPKGDKDGAMHLREFGRLPVVMNGRVQPLDSVGRNTLLQIRSTGDVPLEQVPSWKFWHHPRKLRSSEWLAEVMFKPEVADTRPIFLIHHPELLSELNIEDKGVEKSGLRYYTFNELITNKVNETQMVIDRIQEEAQQAGPIDEKLRTPLQKQVMKLYHALFIYNGMKAAARPVFWQDFEKELAAFEKVIGPGADAVRARDAGQEYDQEAYAAFWPPVTQFFRLSSDGNAGQKYPLIIPPFSHEEKTDEWISMSKALMESVRHRSVPQPVKAYAAMASAYARDDITGFNTAVASYNEWLGKDFSKQIKKGKQEFFFNDTKAFLHSMIIYICAFLLGCGALLTLTAVPTLSESLRKSALWLIILAGLVHTFGLIFRMYLEARPPVTNLYSSAIFIGWGAMVLGLILERFYRVGLGCVVAAFNGFVSLVIAHNLALGGDTMEMMRAVLDTNFWLATHVVAITMGYASVFVAGVLAIAFIMLGLFTNVLNVKAGKVDIGKALSKMVYGITCFSIFFAFVGTVLGGIWADQSWGRFWGWDPKENGALLIVLWLAVMLHARWGGLVRERGFMNMAIFGNIVTAFSWFGVNMLGVGLHSYGFMDAAFKWLMLFNATQVAIIALGLIPLRYWRSFRREQPQSLPAGEAPAPSAA